MHPLRVSLFALLLLAVLGLSQEAEAEEVYLELVGNYNTDVKAVDVTISGNYAYFADDGDYGLVIINIEDPENPTLAGNYSTGNYPSTVTISGNYAYVGEDNNGELIIVSIEDPENPTFVGSYNCNDTVTEVIISGDYAYITGYRNGLFIVNIEDPENPTLVGSYETGTANDVTISGNYAYIADVYEGLVIVNIEDPENPTLVGSYETDNAQGVTILGTYAYIADFHKLVIVNIEDPENPTLVGSYDTELANDVAISGNYAYIASYGNGLFIVNIEDPENPTLAGSYETENVNSVTISGNYVYISDGYEGLVILELGYTPVAVIDSIYPSPARISDKISFSGSGEDYDGMVVAYEWESSIDGFLSNEEGFSATGLSVGSHNISFRVKDNSNRWSDYDYFDLFVNANFFPLAVVDSIYPSPSEKGTTVFFNGTSSDSDGAIVTYVWESSIDGELSNEEDFTTANLSLGYHTIMFMVEDNDGAWSSSQESGGNVSIPDISLWIYASPVAIAGQNATGTPGVPLQFSGAGTDEDGTIAKYEWDFDGDGIFEWSSTENGRELNVYNNEGTYTATLRVTDNDGFTATDTVVAIISEKTIQLDDDGNVVVEDAGEDDEGIPSVSLLTSLISIGLLAIFRRK